VSKNDNYTLYKKYPICFISGKLGPKRQEGDLQVPEGFYHINDFNPHSKYHLSLGVSYPNQSDKILSPFKNLGGQIYIHGDCVSTGCIAIGNKNIEELYEICNQNKNRIEVHIFPIDFRNENSVNHLNDLTSKDGSLFLFEYNLKQGFDYFEKNKKLPSIDVDSLGFYRFISDSLYLY
jgi:murein L,D-transpeptidase YafK